MRKVAIIALLALLSAGAMYSFNTCMNTKRVAANSTIDIAFNNWLNTQNKMYASPAEKAYRKSLFANNYNKVVNMNKVMSHESELNAFADLTVEEFVSKYTGLKSEESDKILNGRSYLADIKPRNDGVNWR